MPGRIRCGCALVGDGVRGDRGEEKPLKYPVMFRAVDLVVVNKIDLLPYLDFDIDLFEANLDTVNPTARTIRVSTKTGVGLPD